MGEGLTKAGESGLVGAEAHPTEHGLAGEVGAPGQGTRAQRGPLVQSSKVGPGWGQGRRGSQRAHASPKFFLWTSLWLNSISLQPMAWAGKPRAGGAQWRLLTQPEGSGRASWRRQCLKG